MFLFKCCYIPIKHLFCEVYNVLLLSFMFTVKSTYNILLPLFESWDIVK